MLSFVLYPHSSYYQPVSNRFIVCVRPLSWEMGVGVVVMCLVLVCWVFLKKEQAQKSAALIVAADLSVSLLTSEVLEKKIHSRRHLHSATEERSSPCYHPCNCHGFEISYAFRCQTQPEFIFLGTP